MKKILKAVSVSGVLYVLPVVAFAVAGNNPGAELSTGKVKLFIENIVGFINSVLVPAIFAIAFLVFVWGMFQYFVWGGADEAKRESGKQLMLWAIIGFVLMISVWGIVNIVSQSLGLKGDVDRTFLPKAPTPGAYIIRETLA